MMNMPIPVALFDRLMGEVISPRESVKRELVRFFNTRPSCEAVIEDKGVPEWREVYVGDERAVQQFCRQLRDGLLHHDPRIKALTVEAVGVCQQRLTLCLTMTLCGDNDPLTMNINWQQDRWQSPLPGEINGRSITG